MFLKNITKKRCLEEHWVNNLIKPILFLILYVRAEREGEFGLNSYPCKQMLP